MSIELRDDEIAKVWAWVMARGGPHDVLGCFYEGFDGQLHFQWRLATRDYEGQPREERQKTFTRLAKPLPQPTAGIREEIASFASHVTQILNCETVKILAVEGDLSNAIQMLEDNTEPGELDKHLVH